MSYILDALRKSEQERHRGKLPDLNRFGDDAHARKSVPRWAVIVGSVLLASNVIAIGAWLMRSTAPEQEKTAASVPIEASGNVVARVTQTTTPSSTVSNTTPPSNNGLPTSQTTQPPAAAVANAASASSGGLANGNIATGTIATGNVGNTSTPTIAVTPNMQAAAVVAAPPAGTVYYVAQQGAVPGQQIVVLPAGTIAPTVVAPGTVAPGTVVPGSLVSTGTQGNVVYQLPVAGQASVGAVNGVAPSAVQNNGWNSTGTAVQPPPPVPPPPVNLEQPVDGMASSELQGGNMSSGNTSSGNMSAGRASSSSVPAVSYMPKLEELPSGLRQQVPDMTFSSHMYSSMPRFRSVVINGTRVREGQAIGNNLQINEITETGVILSINGTPFQVDVLGKWSQ